MNRQYPRASERDRPRGRFSTTTIAGKRLVLYDYATAAAPAGIWLGSWIPAAR